MGLELEADPRHSELIIEQLELDKEKHLSTPGSDDDCKDDEESAGCQWAELKAFHEVHVGLEDMGGESSLLEDVVGVGTSNLVKTFKDVSDTSCESQSQALDAPAPRMLR